MGSAPGYTALHRMRERYIWDICPSALLFFCFWLYELEM
jgi:hypothetical protein